MVQRNPAQRFMGGMWVFPGGSFREGDADELATAAARARGGGRDPARGPGRAAVLALDHPGGADDPLRHLVLRRARARRAPRPASTATSASTCAGCAPRTRWRPASAASWSCRSRPTSTSRSCASHDSVDGGAQRRSRPHGRARAAEPVRHPGGARGADAGRPELSAPRRDACRRDRVEPAMAPRPDRRGHRPDRRSRHRDRLGARALARDRARGRHGAAAVRAGRARLAQDRVPPGRRDRPRERARARRRRRRRRPPRVRDPDRQPRHAQAERRGLADRVRGDRARRGAADRLRVERRRLRLPRRQPGLADRGRAAAWARPSIRTRRRRPRSSACSPTCWRATRARRPGSSGPASSPGRGAQTLLDEIPYERRRRRRCRTRSGACSARCRCCKPVIPDPGMPVPARARGRRRARLPRRRPGPRRARRLQPRGRGHAHARRPRRRARLARAAGAQAPRSRATAEAGHAAAAACPSSWLGSHALRTPVLMSPRGRAGCWAGARATRRRDAGRDGGAHAPRLAPRRSRRRSDAAALYSAARYSSA